MLEITSRATWREDQRKKRELYRRLRVREYWQYDPTRDYLEPPLQSARYLLRHLPLASEAVDSDRPSPTLPQRV